MDFTPTHKITLNGTATPVMLVDGAAYARGEWEADAPADWECADGEWLFQGSVLVGEYEVETLSVDLYLVSEGEAVEYGYDVALPSGVYGQDWVAVEAYDTADALRVAREYDRTRHGDALYGRGRGEGSKAVRALMERLNALGSDDE